MTAVSVGLQTQLDQYRYIYAGVYVGYTGTYFSSSHTAIISNSNYAYIEQNRVYNKIQRILYQAYLPYLNSQLQLNADSAMKEFVSGRTKNIHETMLAIEQADVSLKMMMQVRNKIIEAYREIMKMQV